MDSDAIHIRSYRDEDESDVVRLWRSVFPDDPPWNEPVSVIRRKQTVQPDLFLVAVRADSVVGTAIAGFDGCRGWVHHVGVAPEVRRRGIGRRLLEEAAARLRALGCPKLNLQVRGANDGAVRFYERVGFRTEDRVSMAQLLGPESGGP